MSIVDELTAEDRVARAWWVVCEASRRRFGYLHARIGVVSSSSLLDPKNVYPAPVSGTSVTGGWGWGRQILEMGESSYVPLLQGVNIFILSFSCYFLRCRIPMHRDYQLE